jgi:hypothetical protein
MKLLSDKKQNWSWDYPLQVPDDLDFWVMDITLKEFCCTCIAADLL